MEDKIEIVDSSALEYEEPQFIERPKEPVVEPVWSYSAGNTTKEGLVNCLRKELVKVQFIPDKSFEITDKTHPYWGGKANGTWDAYTVPLLRNGTYKNPLTTEEKNFLEDYMGLEPNALSVHKGENNFWENRHVFLTKYGDVLDLSTPMGFINYKILLTNTNEICPSLAQLKKTPKATYRYVLVSDNEVYSSAAEKVSTKSACWKAYGKIEEDFDSLKSVIQSITGLAVDRKSDLTFLQEQAVNLIDSNPQAFLKAATDKYLSFRVIIEKAVEKNVIERRGDYYYYMNNPLCGKDENPTITVAAKYISEPKNQEILFSIQSRLN